MATNLTFGTLQQCLDAEDQMRRGYAEAYNAWSEWARNDPQVSGYPDSQTFMESKIGLHNWGTCIPHRPNSR